MVYEYLDEKLKETTTHVGAINRKLQMRRVYSSYRDKIWGADLAVMQSISKCNIGVRFLLLVIKIYKKYAWFVPLKDKKIIGITKDLHSKN